MYGKIRCATRGCSRERSTQVCPRCRGVRVFLDCWDAKRHKRAPRISVNRHARPLMDIQEAKDLLATIRQAYNHDRARFDIHTFTPRGIKERLFEYQADAWLSHMRRKYAKGEISPETIKKYKGYVRNHFTGLHGHDVRDIDFGILEDFALNLTGAPKSRRVIMGTLHSVFNHMHRNKVITAVPAWPTVQGATLKRRSSLTWSQQQEALAKFPPEAREEREAIEFGMELGLRPAELCALQAGDINPATRVLSLVRGYSDGKLVDTTKGKHPDTLPLTERAWEIVRERLLALTPDEFLFTNPRTGRGFRPKVLLGAWKEHSGWECGQHDAMRRSFINQLVDDNVNTSRIKQAARHRHISTTQGYVNQRHTTLREDLEARGRRDNVVPLRKQDANSE